MEQLILTQEERLLLDLTAAPLAPARQAQLADFVLAEIGGAPKRTRRRTFGFLAAILATLTLSGGVAAYAWVATSKAPIDPYLVYCYPDTNPDRGEGRAINSITALGGLDGSPPPLIDAVTGCAESWSLGAVRAPDSPLPLKNSGNPVPQLTACVDNKGYTVVFPSDSSICTRLGFSSLR